MNYLDASIRGVKLQKKQIPNSKKNRMRHPDCYWEGELNPKRMKYLDASIRGVKLQKKQIPDSKKKSE
jgi:hypothetical protein